MNQTKIVQNVSQKNGRFVKKKFYARNCKALDGMREAKKEKMINETKSESNVSNCEGSRIVEVQELAKNLRCIKCQAILSLENIQNETRIGLYSCFHIVCDICKMYNKVNTGKIENGKADLNKSIILGAIHSGTGNTSLNKLLACANIPIISPGIYKHYEDIVGKVIEEEANRSYRRAATEERQLVIEKIQELSDKL